MATAVARTGFPPQIKYIVGNEAAERFSYYGMRSILVIFITQHLMLPASTSKEIFHYFTFANYFAPLVGAYLSDRYFGKYHTILFISLFYCLGHGILAAFESETGLYVGLAFIACGAGGIKPCVSAHVGDQFGESNKHLLQKIYEIFYFSINFGSFFSVILIPLALKYYGASVAFGIPGILMAIATFIFWLGRKQYVIVPPTGKAGSAQFVPIVAYGLKNLGSGAGGHWLDVAKQKYPEKKVEGAKAVVGVFAVFAAVTGFWALYDQHSASWVLQAEAMDRNVFGMHLESSQIPALNPILVMLMIPLFSKVIYPGIEKLGLKVTPLRKMGAGMAMTALSFYWVGMLQQWLDAGQVVNVSWQIAAYIILTAAEVLVSITGLEFAYTQAPREMKSTMMSFFFLTIAFGNLLTAVVSGINPFSGGAMEFYFYATLMVVVAAIFIFMATRYQERSFIESGAAVGH